MTHIPNQFAAELRVAKPIGPGESALAGRFKAAIDAFISGVPSG